MGLIANLKAQRAYSLHGKGQTEEARKLYKEAIDSGCDQPRYILAYCLLIIRAGEYEEAKQRLIKLQKNPMLTPEQKSNLFVYYSVCAFRLGEIDKGIHLLERQSAKQPTGQLYQTLGYLYVEKFDLSHLPDFEALDRAEQEKREAAALAEAEENGEGSAEVPPAAEEPPVILSAREKYDAHREKAEAFLKEAIDYDDEDSVCLDNYAQFLYRCDGDEEAARPWFEKALAIKDTQIDTLWFLSRYDLKEGKRQQAIQRLEQASKGRFSPLNFATKELVDSELKTLKLKA